MLDKSKFTLPENPFSGFNKTLEDLSEAFKKVTQGFKVIAKELPPSLKTLAKYGWYISGNSGITDGIVLAAEAAKGNAKKVDNILQKFYEKESASIIYSLKKDFPERIKLFDEAFKAHKRKMYFASTSLFLSLADGLCSGSLFITKNNKAILKKKLENTTYMEEFLNVILEVSAIDTAHYTKNKFPSTLNRHGVLHGLDFDYGTKINSLKALSLLAFIGDFFPKRKS